MTSLINFTNSQQAIAANPNMSVWATANAGAGKTKVLIDRIARILLNGTDPAKILAVTYTKAAAAEMTTRLFETLGRWTIASDEELEKALLALDKELPLDGETLQKARALFANALETPGGLKVQTIHAFCGDVLKRFPIEAGVAPGFETADEVNSEAIKSRAFDVAYSKSPEVFNQIAAQTSLENAKQLLAKAAAKLGRNFKFDESIKLRLERYFKVKIDEAVEDEIATLIDSLPTNLFKSAASILTQGAKTDNSTSEVLLEILTLESDAAYEALLGLIFTTAGEIRKSAPKTKKFDNDATICELFGGANTIWPSGYFGDIYESAVKIENLRIAKSTYNLINAANLWRAEYVAQKTQMGLLDFDDLLAITSNLLNRDKGSALWVMYKLDKGLDHILIDESQDTSAEQWDLINPLLDTLESGSRDIVRTQFVVGDDKQSIYRFQGASPERYEEEQEKFLKKDAIYENKYTEVNFSVSFRTGETILSAVDCIWHDAYRNGDGAALEIKRQALGSDYDAISRSHFSARQSQSAVTELWDIVKGDEEAENLAAHEFPLDAENSQDSKSKLSDLIAREIQKRIANKQAVWDKNGKTRPCKASDFMILVKGRSALYHRIIKRLKRYGVQVAGADLIILKKEPAILDLLSVAQFVLCPSDDFNTACMLKSGFLNLYDDDKHLFPICHNRGVKTVAQMLMASDDTAYDKAKSFIANIKKIGASLPPYDFFAKILETKIDGDKTGWELLLERFGHEAREPIEIFLDLALNATSIGAPNLIAFIDYIENKAQSVKREFDAAEEGVKVMTIHGSKGREAPIVILPDTTRALKSVNDRFYYSREIGLPIYAPQIAFKTEELKKVTEEEKELNQQEDSRLLYVGMTRARDRLILCGAFTGKKSTKGYGDDSWYGKFNAFLPSEHRAFKTVPLHTEINAKIWGDIPSAQAEILPKVVHSIDLPEWLNRSAPFSSEAQKIIAPSGLVDEDYEPPTIPPINSNIKQRFRRGSLIHELLEVLPQIAPENQKQQAQMRLKREVNLDDDLRADIINEALKIINDPQFGLLFGENSRAEVAIMGSAKSLPSEIIINGAIDRMVVTENEVLVLDYKTNRPPPKTIEDCPKQYVRQMACYFALLGEIYPDKLVKCALLWTDIPQIMEIPAEIMCDELAKLR